MNNGLPHHADFGDSRKSGDGINRAAGSYLARANECPQKMDGGDADDRHGELNLEHAGVDMAQPLRLIGMPFKLKVTSREFSERVE